MFINYNYVQYYILEKKDFMNYLLITINLHPMLPWFKMPIKIQNYSIKIIYNSTWLN